MPLARSSLLLVLALSLPAPAAWARTRDADACAQAIAAVERISPLPRGLLAAVAFAESGRRDPERARAVAWPWTVNNAGDGRYFASKAEAMAHVEALRAKGKRNIDVGCMQINLMHHPDAFASLEAAFEPMTNVAYGARYLQGLERETGSWQRAIERYHTADPARGQAYRARVLDRARDIRLADAVAGGQSRGGLRLGAARAPLVAAERPPLPARDGRLTASASRGFLRLTPTRSAALGPLDGRPAVGKIRKDGRIAGSRLRIGPRRSVLGRSTPPEAAEAAPGRSAAPATG